MIKCLEEIKRLKWGFDITNEERINLCECIEKELKQAEKDKEMLDIFKNALTIKHTCVLPQDHDHSKDTFVCAVRYLYEITQNDLDEKLRKSLREWVLKNAFPKELKDKEQLEKAFDSLSKENEKVMKELSKEIEKNRALEIIKEKRVNVDNFLNHIKKDTDYKEYQRLCGLYKITVFSGKKLTQEEYDLLREVLR